MTVRARRAVPVVAAGAVLVVVFLAVAGCSRGASSAAGSASSTSSTSRSAAAPSAPSTPSTPSARATTHAIFDGPEPVSAVTWWAEHPDLQPPGIDDETLLLNRRGVGSQMLRVPSLTGYTKLDLILTCTEPAPYVVQVGTTSNPAWAWTKGNSCGGPNINSYTTGKLDPHNPLRDLYVMVPAGTHFFVTLYGVPRTITAH
jgi:hypothetical protein